MDYCIHIPKKFQVKKTESLVMKIMKRFYRLVNVWVTFYEISVMGIVKTIFSDFVMFSYMSSETKIYPLFFSFLQSLTW